ncbi:MAG: hypothetical protein IPN94_25740 [Sphingobacteriales bacterium]|nr:hypothetical protein [Sphingobacteriales bacterium]
MKKQTLYIVLFITNSAISIAQNSSIGEPSYTKELVSIPSLMPIQTIPDATTADVSNILFINTPTKPTSVYHKPSQMLTGRQINSPAVSKRQSTLWSKLNLLKIVKKSISKPRTNMLNQGEANDIGGLALGSAILGAVFLLAPSLGIAFAPIIPLLGLIFTIIGFISSIIALKNPRKIAAILGLSISVSMILLLLIGLAVVL